MAKEKTCYVCASCGYETARWLGCCPDCGEWNTFEERKTVSQTPVASKTAEKAARYQTTQKSEAIPLSQVQERSMPRSSTGNEELDRVLGGGLVPGSAILIGGDPGIGKSTLLLQVAGSLSRQCRVLYVSGEESAHQIKMRASRIGVPQDTLYVLTENDVESVLEKCGRMQPDVLVNRLHPDHGIPGQRQRAGKRVAGASERGRHRALCQGNRHIGVHRGARYKGRKPCGPARAGAHGGCCALLRGGPTARIPAASRSQKPLRLGQRAGCV